MVSFSELIQRRKDLQAYNNKDVERKKVTTDGIRETRRGENYLVYSGTITPVDYGSTVELSLEMDDVPGNLYINLKTLQTSEVKAILSSVLLSLYTFFEASDIDINSFVFAEGNNETLNVSFVTSIKNKNGLLVTSNDLDLTSQGGLASLINVIENSFVNTANSSLEEGDTEWIADDFNILDITNLINFILDNFYNDFSDLNSDGGLNILDVVILVNLILD